MMVIDDDNDDDDDYNSDGKNNDDGNTFDETRSVLEYQSSKHCISCYSLRRMKAISFFRASE